MNWLRGNRLSALIVSETRADIKEVYYDVLYLETYQEIFKTMNRSGSIFCYHVNRPFAFLCHGLES